jgi:predicted PurR-regulated permease PerM
VTKGWRIAIWVSIVAALLYFLYLVRGILPPFIIAFVITLLLEPTISALRKKGIPKPLAIVIVFAAFLLVFGAIIVWVSPIIVQQAQLLVTTVQDATSRVAAADTNSNFFVSWNPVVQADQFYRESPIDALLEQYREVLTRFGLPSTRQGIYLQFVEPYQDDITGWFQTFIEGFLGFLLAFFQNFAMYILTPLIVVFMLADSDNYKERIANFIPPSLRANTLEIISEVGAVFISYLRGISLAVLLFGIANALVWTVMGVPYSFLLAVVFAILYLIPYLNHILNATILGLTIFATGTQGNFMFDAGSPLFFALICIGIYLVLGPFLMDNICIPKLVGGSVGLSPVVSIFAIFSGAALFGVVGMILAFPVAGAINVVFQRLVRLTSQPKPHDFPTLPMRHRSGRT